MINHDKEYPRKKMKEYSAERNPLLPQIVSIMF